MKRRSSRPRYPRRTALMLGLLVLVATSAWVLTRIEPEEPQTTHSSLQQEPEFFIENFVTTTLDANGRLSRRIEAKYMAHMPDTDANEFVEPYMQIYRGSGEPWQVTSENGWASARGDVLLLLGKVHIWRDNARGERSFDVRTADMRILPKSDFAETDKLAVISTPRSETRGIGMRVYLEQSRIELLSQVRTVYEQGSP